MSRFFKHEGVLMFEPDPIAGNAVTRKATAAECEQYEADHKPMKPADHKKAAPKKPAKK